MKSLKFAVAALVCLSVVGSAAVSHAVPVTDVVFGNLGSSGTNALDPSTNSGVTDTTWFAQGFTVGGTNNVLNSVTLGMYDNNGTVARVQLFASGTGSTPTGSALATLTQPVSSSSPTLQTFSFSPSLALSVGSSYWVVVSTTEANGLFNWSFNDAADNPTVQNASGYSALNPVTIRSTNSGGSWVTANGNRASSISITAVPEPSSIVLAGLGVLAAGYQLRRRRLKRA